MPLKAKELCPIHRRRDCCGRREVPTRHKVANRKNEVQIAPGVFRLSDGRIRRTKAAIDRYKKHRLRMGDRCAACGEAFDDFREVELAHIESCGMNSHKRHDGPDNLVLLHKGANRAQGSMPLDVYLKTTYKPEHCKPI